MRKSNLEEVASQFVAFFSLVDSNGESGFIESFRGMAFEFPHGFIDYIEYLILEPLDNLSLQGIYEREFRLLKSVISSMKEGDFCSLNENVKKNQIEFFEPLLEEFKQLVHPAENSVAVPLTVGEDDATSVFNDVWKKRLETHLTEVSGTPEVGLYKKNFEQVLNKKTNYSSKRLNGYQGFFSESIRLHFGSFYTILTKAANCFYCERTKAVLSKSITDIINAYHLFFRSIQDDLKIWLSTKFGKGGDSRDNYVTFFCMIKGDMTVGKLLSGLNDLNPSLTESLLYFLDFLKDELATVAFDSQNEEGEHYSLFYACYSSLFTALTESARTLYAKRVKEQSSLVEKRLFLDKQGKEAANTRERIRLMQTELTQLFLKGQLYCSLKMPRWIRVIFIAFKKLAVNILSFFNPTIRTIKADRVRHLEACARDANTALYSKEADGRVVLSNFFRNLTAENTPITRHRMTLFSEKSTRSCYDVISSYQKYSLISIG